MSKAKKLPSGSWRCLAYSHSEPAFDKNGKPIIDPKTKKQKTKRIYESFTSDNPTQQGKREAEASAALFQLNKSKVLPKKNPEYRNMTLREAIDKYIDSHTALCSPTTIQDYLCIQKFAFQDLMDIKLKDLDEIILTEAVNLEAQRPNSRYKKTTAISPKRLKNEWGLVTAILNTYLRDLDYNISLPKSPERVPELLPADVVLQIINGSDIELPVLLACWLSYSMSEVLGLTKSKSLRGDCLVIAETVVTVDGKPVRKEVGKNPTRNRMHRIPPYIKKLIDQVDGDIIVQMTGSALYHKWIKLQAANGIEQRMTFHDLRHLNASVMALLRVPDKYAQERGGWKSDKVMKHVYMQTISEERVKVDNLIDGYFDSILNTEKNEVKETALTPEEIIEILQEKNPDGWQDALLEFMQHELQHNKKKA